MCGFPHLKGMSANQERAKKSKDRILAQFSTSAHGLASSGVSTFSSVAYILAATVFIIILVVVVVVCALAVMYTPAVLKVAPTGSMYGYYSARTASTVGGIVVVLAGIILVVAVEASIVSAERKMQGLADNAVNLASSQQAVDALNKAAKVYNDIAM